MLISISIDEEKSADISKYFGWSDMYIMTDLYHCYDGLESLISEYKHSSISRKEFVEELEIIEVDFDEFTEENEDEINEIVEISLSPIKEEIKKFKKEKHS